MTNRPLKKALVVGATGLIGDLLTHRLLDSAYYETVTVLVRRPLGWSHPRLREQLVDFDAPAPLTDPVDDAFCCLGTTMKKAGSKGAFQKVDYQYPLDVARLARQAGATQYAIVTSMGADPDSSFFYNRVKGEIERDLAALDYPTLLIYRPSLLLGERHESRLGERLAESAMRLLNPLIPAKYKGIDASRVASAMLKTAQQSLTGRHVFESDVLQGF